MTHDKLIQLLQTTARNTPDDIITCEKVTRIIEVDEQDIQDYWRENIVILETQNHRHYIMYRKEAVKLLGYDPNNGWEPKWALLRMSVFTYGVWAWYRGTPNFA